MATIVLLDNEHDLCAYYREEPDVLRHTDSITDHPNVDSEFDVKKLLDLSKLQQLIPKDWQN